MNRLGLPVIALLILPTAATAHGPQLQVTNTDGKIITREVLVNTYSPLTEEKRAYVSPVQLVGDLEFGPSWRLIATQEAQYPFGPGLAYGVDATFPTNSTFTWTFLEELKVWDGGAFVSAGATELAALRTSNPDENSHANNAGVSGGADPSTETPIGDAYDSNAHASVTWVLLGDGADPASAVADGVYRATLQITSSEPTIAPSDPMYLILNKGSASELTTAVSSLGLPPSQVQYLAIPEPSCLALSLPALLCGSGRRRTR